MCVCAGKLAWGAAGGNACPAGSYVIVDATQCRAAAVTAGGRFDLMNSYPTLPRGCFGALGDLRGDFILNTDPTGGADPDWQPLCAVGAAGVCVGAWVRACLRVFVCVSVCVCVCA
jgi:hypothetical protein